MAVTVRWNPGPIKKATNGAFRTAALGTKMMVRPPARSIGVSLRFKSNGRATLRATGGLAHLFEGGVKPHEISPTGMKRERTTRRRTRSKESGLYQTVTKTRTGAKRGGKKAIRFPSGDFASGVIEHPGFRARPYFMVAAMQFPRNFSRALLRSPVFRRF